MNRLLQHQRVYKRPRKRLSRRSFHVPIAKGFAHVKNKSRTLKRLVISGFIRTYRLHFIGGGAVFAVFLVFLAAGIIPFGSSRRQEDTTAAIAASMSASVTEPLVFIGSPDSADFRSAGENGDDKDALGTGVHVVSRESDLYHRVKEGETLSEIARFYNISIENLALYNNLEDPNAIYTGKKIHIPSYAKEEEIQPRPILRNTQLAVANSLETKAVNLPPVKLSISAEKEFTGTDLTANFSFSVSENIELKEFTWHFGNGLKSYVPSSSYTYNKPGTYKVYLEAYDSYGRNITSNELFIDVPHPYTYADSSHRFLTVSNVDEPFVLDGEIIDVHGYDRPEDIFRTAAGPENGQYEYTAAEPGYFACTVKKEDLLRQVFLFVSPIESVHVETNTLNWYRTQFNTGTLGNCGPAAVSMAAAWAREKYVPVINIRQSIGWRGEGGTNFDELIDVMGDHGVTAMQQPISSAEDIFSIIDNGNIAIVLFHTGGISAVKGDPAENFFGKYYPDAVGHYVVLKGYSADKQYFIVQDPIPSDWGSNAKRHADTISMIGRNRYYAVDEMMNSLRVKVVIKVVR
jgi:LysM repeat protein